MSTGGSATAVHRGPAPPASTGATQALVVAFPEPAALPLPPTGQAVGRDWLAATGVHDGEVSSEHLRFDRSGGIVRVEDLGSRNGIWVGGHRLPSRRKVPLDEGAVLRLGSTVLVYRAALAGELAPAPCIGELVGPYGLRASGVAYATLGMHDTHTVLIEGETGTGKELLARAVAQALGRAEPYLAVNVSGVAAGVFESQLFGHVKGAFSDAREASRGAVLAHEGGAVFLDELGELPLELQPKLLRLVENREILPVGAERARQVDVLLIAATNRDLEEMVETGGFRRDLWARLATVRLGLPPLRQRAEDLFAIAQALELRAGRRLEPAATEVEAVERLLLHDWPNNVRELGAVLSAVRSIDPKPGLRLWAVDKQLGPAPTSAGVLTDETVGAALAACDGNETQAARRLGVSRGRLRRFLNKG